MEKMEDIINDILPSYHQWPNLAHFQMDFLAAVLDGELKTFAKWVQQNEDFNKFIFLFL